jgi:hypothetical protein
MNDDPRYAQFDEMYLVMRYDRHDEPQVVAETEDLARTYIAGQWSDEGYSTKPIKVIRTLPEPRTLYMIQARLPYGSAPAPAPRVDEYTEFPGLGNGALVPLGEVTSTMSEYVPYGWDVNSVSWDLAKAQAVFEERMAEARQVRDARNEAFDRFPIGSVVRTPDGETLIRSSTRQGVLCWNSTSNKVIHDASIDPAALTVIATG